MDLSGMPAMCRCGCLSLPDQTGNNRHTTYVAARQGEHGLDLGLSIANKSWITDGSPNDIFFIGGLMKAAVGLFLIALSSTQADAAGSLCPLAPYPDSTYKLNQELLDPTTAKPWGKSADQFPYSSIKIGGDFDPKLKCSEVVMEYEIRHHNEVFSGVATRNSQKCRGKCNHSIDLDLSPMISYKWRVRANIDYYCTDLETGECFDKPVFSKATSWVEGQPFRHFGKWSMSPGVDRFIFEPFVEIGAPLGDESESDRTEVADGIFMNFGSKPIAANNKHRVQWFAPIEFRGSEYIEGEFRAATKSTGMCREKITIESFSERKEVVVFDGNIAPGALRINQKNLTDFAGWLRPRTGNFGDVRDVIAHFSCEGDQPFVYGADFVSIRARELVQD